MVRRAHGGAGGSCALTPVRGSRSAGVPGDDERMGVFGRTRVYGRRRQPNPLRRRSDVVEAWTALVVAVLLFVGAPLAGVFAARWAYDEGRATASAQRAERHRVHAVAVAGIGAGAPPAPAGRQYLYRVRVLWTEPGAGARTATAQVPAGTRRGDAVDLWLDAHGRAVAPPPGAAAVRQYTVAVGIWASGVTAGLVLLARTALHRTAVQRRLGEWERAWARTEPEWTGRRA
ncbi:hypothetical protein T45_07109 [Streptomyces turgidiscabies]|nr:hypothetical protein T45_07109 [Streptomyces turgidiscabies]